MSSKLTNIPKIMRHNKSHMSALSKEGLIGGSGVRGLSRVFLILTCFGLWLACVDAEPLHEYSSFVRPDGAYKIVVYRRSERSILPGQAGDARGIARLYDRSGRLLAETELEMVQLVEHVDWSDDKASIKLVVEWDLSRLARPHGSR